eukprot:Skav201737  [mRNA]  locus=scaffold2498:93595:99256:+ [translate_table: standard]
MKRWEQRQDSSPVVARNSRSTFDAGRQKELQLLGLMALEVRAVSSKLRHLGVTPDTEVAVRNAREVHELLSAELSRLSHEMKADWDHQYMQIQVSDFKRVDTTISPSSKQRLSTALGCVA